jgi:hypothetical protein
LLGDVHVDASLVLAITVARFLWQLKGPCLPLFPFIGTVLYVGI